MSRLDVMLRQIYRSETRLAHALEAAAQQHASDPEIGFLARDLAAWSREHCRRVHALAASRRIDLDDVDAPTPSPAADRDALGGDNGPLRLLAELRGLHQEAVGVSTDWEMLAQGAAASSDTECADLAARCRPRTQRQIKWANTLLKTRSPQALSVG